MGENTHKQQKKRQVAVKLRLARALTPYRFEFVLRFVVHVLLLLLSFVLLLLRRLRFRRRLLHRRERPWICPIRRQRLSLPSSSSTSSYSSSTTSSFAAVNPTAAFVPA